MEKIDCRRAAELFRSWDHILVLSHASPDGDTLGSASALLRGLKALGKEVSFACADPVEPKFSYLFEGLPLWEGEIDHVVSVDVADLELLKGLREVWGDKIQLAIDHHGSRKGFGSFQWVEETSAATTELVFLLLEELGVEITPEMADCIYTGLTTDTGCFRYRSVTPRTHQIAARTIELGARAGDINQWMFETKSKAQLAAERTIVDGMEFFCDGKCAMAAVPLSVYKETGARESDLEGAASLPRQIEGVVLGITVKEKEDGVKASVRSNPPADSAEFCARFGGGGHIGAGGCAFPGKTLEEAKKLLRDAAEEYFQRLKI